MPALNCVVQSGKVGCIIIELCTTDRIELIITYMHMIVTDTDEVTALLSIKYVSQGYHCHSPIQILALHQCMADQLPSAYPWDHALHWSHI